ncbi:MAG: hypothetical protein ACP5XB_30895 [Isosphaeraceae bacterium]
MVLAQTLERLDSLIDDLLNESDLPASSLASILIAARDSVQEGYHVALARRVWDASNSIRDHHIDSLTTADPVLDVTGIDQEY